MRRGELEDTLSRTNAWWSSHRTRRPWQLDDKDLLTVGNAPFDYRPRPLDELKEGGLYVLLGPRRVGKSVEIKRSIEELIDRGVERRQIIHSACDGWRRRDLMTLLDVAQGIAPQDAGPRFFFLDEVTSISDDWVSQLKWMRDNTALRDDCVVITGSSSANLDNARAQLAGRRGPVQRPDRILLPMGFRSFCQASGFELPPLPTLYPSDLLGEEASSAIFELRPFLTEIVALWERYLEIGGFPRAVSDWVSNREVSPEFVDALWDVIYRDALRTDHWSPAQTQTLLEEVSACITSTFNQSTAARDLGNIHYDTLTSRLSALIQNYIIWPCYRNEEDRPKLRSQRKLYFLDPLQARLAALRKQSISPPDYTQLSEQQIGVSLLRSLEYERPGTLSDYDDLLFLRTASRSEIDFTGDFLRGLPYEAKYTEGRWRRDSLTAHSVYSRGIFATRNVIDHEDDLLALPAAFIALLIDPTPQEAMSLEPALRSTPAG